MLLNDICFYLAHICDALGNWACPEPPAEDPKVLLVDADSSFPCQANEGAIQANRDARGRGLSLS